MTVANAESLMNIARMYRDGVEFEKNIELAIKYMKTVHTVTPGWTKEYLDLLIYSRDKKYHEEIFKIATQYHTCNSGIAMILARLYRDGIYTQRDLEKAAEIMRDACLDNPNWIVEYVDLLIQLYDDKYYSEIISMCETSESVVPRLKYFHARVLSLINYKNNLTKILELMKDVSEMEPDLFPAYLDLCLRENMPVCIPPNHPKTEAIKIVEKINKMSSKPVTTTHDNRMNIMIISSNEYIKYSIVSLKSFIANHQNLDIHIYIVTTGISQHNTKLLNEFKKREKCTIDVIKFDNSIFKSIHFPDKGLWSKLTLSRLVAHLILPEDVDRVLSIGADVLCIDNIEHLYFADFCDKSIIATLNGPSFENACTDLADNEIRGVNGDMLLINISKIRKSDITIDSILSKNFGTTEEIIIPQLFKSQIMLIDPYLYNYRLDQIEKIAQKNHLIPQHHYIIQFMGFKKPWSTYIDTEISDEELLMLTSDRNRNRMMSQWWDYAKQCPHYVDLVADLRIQRKTIASIVRYSHTLW